MQFKFVCSTQIYEIQLREIVMKEKIYSVSTWCLLFEEKRKSTETIEEDGTHVKCMLYIRFLDDKGGCSMHPSRPGVCYRFITLFFHIHFCKNHSRLFDHHYTQKTNTGYEFRAYLQNQILTHSTI